VWSGEGTVRSTYRLVVRGHLPSALARTVHDRFDDVRVVRGPAHTVLACTVSDQPMLRALLTQLWDVGAEVLVVAQVSTDIPRSHHGHDHG
jgi:hypothetical protein